MCVCLVSECMGLGRTSCLMPLGPLVITSIGTTGSEFRNSECQHVKGGGGGQSNFKISGLEIVDGRRCLMTKCARSRPQLVVTRVVFPFPL